MKRNERITSSWGFLTQGAKTMMCLLVLMLSVQTVFAQQFEYGGVVYDLSDGKATAQSSARKLRLIHLSFPIMSIIITSRILSRLLLIMLSARAKTIER